MFNTPILYIIFNRLDTVKQTFPQIRKQQPKQLFIAADGPRLERVGEAEKCAAVREWVMSQIDWDCDVHTLFRDENLGCGQGPFTAISWFFENVDSGIVLEDDCLPSDSFFPYCAELLEYYKNNEMVMHISGTNTLIDSDINESYWFACVSDCWGWASWKRAWRYYEFDIDGYEEVLEKNKYFAPPPVKNYWKNIYANMSFHKKSAWDYQWVYAILKNNAYAINPTKNLVTNIGCTSDSTHFSDDDSRFMFKRLEIDFPLVHPKKVELNWKNVRKSDKVNFGIESVLGYYINRIENLGKMILKKIGLFDMVKRYYMKFVHSNRNMGGVS